MINELTLAAAFMIGLLGAQLTVSVCAVVSSVL